MKNAGADRAMATIRANNTTAFPVRTKDNVCRGIAWMDFAAETSAIRNVLRAPWRSKAKDTTAFAAQLLQDGTSKANAIRGNATDPAGVYNRKVPKPMEPSVFLVGNAHRAIALTAFVAIPRAPRIAWRVRRRKKEAGRMAYAALSVRSSIRTKNAMVANATGKAFVDSTMARHVHRRANVSRTTAWTGSAVAIFARALVKRVPLLKKAADSMAYAGRLPMQQTRTMNAIPGNAMARTLAISRKRNKPMVRRVPSQRNVYRVSAPMACVVTRRVL